MKNRLLSHWKAKIASLLIAVAVWYVLKGHVRYQEERNIVTDPGTQMATGGLPGAWGEWFSIGLGTEQSLVASERPQAVLLRSHWMELGEFSGGVVEYPAYSCG